MVFRKIFTRMVRIAVEGDEIARRGRTKSTWQERNAPPLINLYRLYRAITATTSSEQKKSDTKSSTQTIDSDGQPSTVQAATASKEAQEPAQAADPNQPAVNVQALPREVHQAARRGDVDAEYQVGKYYLDGGQAEVAFQWLMGAASKYHRLACFEVALCYENGLGVTQDKEKAKLFREKADGRYVANMLSAALGGDISAQVAIASLYEFGYGVEKDMAQAVKWYKSAAEKGHPDALFTLGRFHLNGITLPRDFYHAMINFRKAAEGGNLDAYLQMAKMYDQGLGVQKDEARAKRILMQAAAYGHPKAKDLIVNELDAVERGELAEMAVDYALSQEVAKAPDKMKLFNEVIFLDDNGVDSSEIDQVLISVYGLFVIETKKWSGTICGHIDDTDWITKFENGDIKSHRNPLRQNDGHLKILKKKLGEEIPFSSLIVFYEPIFGNDMPDNVICADQLAEFFHSREQVVSEQMFREMCDRLESLRAQSPNAKSEHTRRVKLKQEAKAKRNEEKFDRILKL